MPLRGMELQKKMTQESSIQKIKEQLQKAQTVTVLTGAGVSAESGVPTFRGSGGLWENYRLEDVATPEAFARDPKKVWEFYNVRIDKIFEIQPNPGHFAIAKLEKKVPEFTLITQNIDGLHAAAGSKNILEIHGNIRQVRCVGCQKITTLKKAFEEVPPFCSCGAMLRPNVVWFGEMLDPQLLMKAQAACTCDVFLCVGTSAQVAPASLLAPAAKAQRAFVVEINPEASENSYLMDEVVLAKAGEFLPKII